MLAGVGDYEQAKSHYEAAHQLYRQYGELRGQSTVLVNLGLLAGDNGDWQAALRYADQALELAQDVGVRRNVAEASGLIGRIRAATGDLSGAEAMYQQALTIREELGQAGAAAEALAGLADTAKRQGDLKRAKLYVQQILDHLAAGDLYGATHPLRVLMTCYHVLASLQDQRDVEILQAAYHLLQERLSHIGDPYWKETFVENVQAHRDILDTYKQRFTGA
jgi:tetratricopeptide (TPR) repeat protein